MVKFTIKRFLCLSLKTCSNIAGVCGIVGCSIGGFKIPPLQNTTSERKFKALCFCILYALVSILLLIGNNKPNHIMMLPWLLFHAFLTFIIILSLIIFHFVGFFILGCYLVCSLLCVWSLFIELKEDAEKNEADASIEFYSEPRQLILDTPQNYIFPVPQKYTIPLPHDDLPPSYDSVINTSASPPRVSS